MNEPFTALTCIDWLGASLRGVVARAIPSPMRCDEDGRLRVIAPALSFAELAATAFGPIRLHSAGNPDVAVHLLHTIADLAPHLHCEADRNALLHHARQIGRDAAQISNESDRQRVETQLNRTLRALAPGDETPLQSMNAVPLQRS